MRFGLVLGAGGLAGEAFHRGVVRGLQDAGWNARAAEIMVGTSAGAVTAASLRASRDQPVEPLLPPEAVSLPASRLSWRVGGGTRGPLHPLLARPGARLSGLLPAGRISTDFISEGFRRRYGGSWPERDTWFVAVRRRDGRRVVFGRAGAPAADVGSAVAASCAIPAYFAPVVIDGVEYVDGGVHSPTNADLLARRRLDVVLVASPMSVRPRSLRPGLDLGFRLNFHRYLAQEVRRLRRSADRVLTFEPSSDLVRVMGLNMMNARHVDEIEDMSYADALGRLRGSRLGPNTPADADADADGQKA